MEDKFQNISAKLLPDIAKNTIQEASNIITIITVLARTTAKEYFKKISKGVKTLELRKDIKMAVDAIKKLKELLESATIPE